ncbi:MAG: COQ9 family protein [Rhodospirillaceae bacterium]|nr:COQ9 family protein [Rhodospirillaceae bacterium]
MTEDLQHQRDRVIEASLAHVPFDGWSWKALEVGALDTGADAILAKRLFARGLGEAAEHFADWADRRMLAELEKMNLGEMRIRDRIHACVKTRIELNVPYKEALRHLLSFLALPHNLPLTSRMTWHSCSLMWYAAGDRSADWNHYTKRGLLVPVYSSTVLYWLSDDGNEDGDFPETWGYLERRIDDVLKTFGLPKRLKERLGRLPRPFRPFRHSSSPFSSTNR